MFSQGYVSGLLGSLLLGCAWWCPGTVMSAVLTWPAAYLLALTAQRKNSLRNLYAAGLLFQPLGFYWLFHTISHFGHFSMVPSILIFGFYTVVSALQFAIFALLHRHLPKNLDRFALRAPLAWVTAEFFSVRIFPWHLGHTEIAFLPFVQMADLIGSLGVSFLIMWIVEAMVLLKTVRMRAAIPLLFALLSISYGFMTAPLYEESKRASGNTLLGKSLSVALVQANVPLEEKHNTESVFQNIDKYLEASRPYDQPDTLIIWPETVLLSWVHTGISHVRYAPRLPKLNDATILFGTLMFSDRETRYNSVIQIRGDGTIGKPYHKQVLMPFGEFTPLGETLPWLRELNATAADFTPGKDPSVHNITFQFSDTTVKAGSLICYEDVMQSLAGDAAVAGAQILVNHTNDAWFGDTVAPYQHHLIAAFRAIENKRYHLRGTNTGLTAIVDPLGRTIASLEPYSEGVLSHEVFTVDEVTFFARHQNTPWWILGLLTIIISGANLLFSRD